MKIQQIDETVLRPEWFKDNDRSAEDNLGPHVLIIDNFYEDPDYVRDLALTQNYVQYLPPLAEQVGESQAAKAEFQNMQGRWHATALLRFRGRPVKNPVAGFRYNEDSLRVRLETVLNESICQDAWASAGDGWNGAFHLRSGGFAPVSVHHHYKEGDIPSRGWSGVVYLSPNPPENTGTSIWLDRETGKCIAAKGALFSKDAARFECVQEIENKYNRLVLFRENVLHKAENGFCDGCSARLTQTFFFRCKQKSGDVCS
ncbi:MAG: hypothetical protein AAFW68_04105 [Pseudomonadota bacterium]